MDTVRVEVPGTTSGNADWLAEFGVSIEDIRRVADAACYGPYKRHADEVLAEVLLRLTRFLRDDRKKLLLVYANKTAVNALKDQIHEAGRQEYIDPHILSSYVGDTSEAGDSLEPSQWPSKDQLLEAVPEPLRECLRLHLDGLSGREIAERLKISKATFWRRLRKAKKDLKRMLRKSSGE